MQNRVGKVSFSVKSESHDCNGKPLSHTVLDVNMTIRTNESLGMVQSYSDMVRDMMEEAIKDEYTNFVVEATQSEETLTQAQPNPT